MALGWRGPAARTGFLPGAFVQPWGEQQLLLHTAGSGRGGILGDRELQLQKWRFTAAREASQDQAASPPSATASMSPAGCRRSRSLVLWRWHNLASPYRAIPPAQPGAPSAGGAKPGTARPQRLGAADPRVLLVHPRPSALAVFLTALPQLHGAAATDGTVKGTHIPGHPSPLAGSPRPARTAGPRRDELR